ncbi:protein tyrosine kinase [Dictyocaulus viviparus]|uniref:Protein tyrosine kinase n=1 Tax=Dictyocaulus viviparus TaxID=29172 RepID=A0A0D8Y4W8_DICVI|nr:protein tyrosine kinase [Dictyocaulus viviparus]
MATNNRNESECLEDCKKYADVNICNTTDHSCWNRCYDMESQKSIDIVEGFHVEQRNLSSFIIFNEVPDATFYVIQYKTHNNAYFNEDNFVITRQPMFSNFDRQGSNFCDPIDIRVSAITPNGTGPLSAAFFVDVPRPFVSPTLQLLSMVYIDTPLVSEFYSANGTVEITFEFNAGAWPLGTEDLYVLPMFHMISCVEPDLSQGVPLPDFVISHITLFSYDSYHYKAVVFEPLYCFKIETDIQIKGTEPNTLFGRLGSDLMHRDCRFVYYAQSISSKQCKTNTEIRSPSATNLQTLVINCDTVRNSPCRKLTVYPAPVCGQIDNINYTVRDDALVLQIIEKTLDPETNNYTLTLNVTFEPIIRKNEQPTIYYKALYGDALPYPRIEEEAFAGVNTTNVTGMTTNCLKFNESGYCMKVFRHDIWEIERRNLVIFDNVKLGSGAFGAVYLGKLLAKSITHKELISPLGLNLMRTETSDVAVKMLPEYVDDVSRGEFLREIGLMKSLGYHERLVNMLACITESEPLCLIMEYCNDGDLLRFLRERCKYMIKLDEAGINYHEAPIDDNYDIDMVITLKQLLMFAVQVSYGLEYLASKGFVHRDVAARNVLVHEKNTCKIGDFGLCRNLYTENSLYKSKGGRLPLKWMSPEAIRHYEFSAQSDVWAFGVLLFEIITLGGSPYPSVPPEEMLSFLERGGRMGRPDNCPDNFYEVMCECWTINPEHRPDFLSIRHKLAAQLEEITEEYCYLTLDAQKDYYNVQYGEEKVIHH